MKLKVIWDYVSGTFLNGFINYSKIFGCWVWGDKYDDIDKNITDRDIR